MTEIKLPSARRPRVADVPRPRTAPDSVPQQRTVEVEAVPHSPAASPTEVARVDVRWVAIRIAALDVVVMAASLGLAWPVRNMLPYVDDPTIGGRMLATQVSPLLFAVWMTVMVLGKAYDVRRLGSGSEEFRIVVKATLVTGLTASTLCYLLVLPLSRGFLLIATASAAVALSVERYLVRRWIAGRRENGDLCQRVLLVGTTREVTDLARTLRRDPRLGYDIVACTLTDPIRGAGELLPAPALGSPHNIAAISARMGADVVMIAGGDTVDLRQLTWELEGSGVDLIVTPRLDDVSAARLQMRPVAGLPMLYVEEPQASRSRRWPKRLFDIVMSVAALVLLSPLMLVVAALIKLADGGPVLFRQARVGLDGATFGVWKFRSMRVDAEAIDAELRREHGYSSGLFKLRDDPRVTRLGRFLRKYSVDELPQLFNVLRGTMSLVGPRPFLQVEIDTFTEEARRRLNVRPGMTGLWQVSGRNRLGFNEMLDLDVEYARTTGLVLDMKILAKTPIAAVSGAA